MTDNDIIKALECCIPISERKCKECPYHEFRFRCITQLIKDTIDLITRQQLEIERLQKTEIEVDDFCRRLCHMRMLNGRAIASYEDLQNYVQEEKSKAVKEFAERLKETKFKQGNDYIIYASNIDILAEEMVGDNK